MLGRVLSEKKYKIFQKHEATNFFSKVWKQLYCFLVKSDASKHSLMRIWLCDFSKVLGFHTTLFNLFLACYNQKAYLIQLHFVVC
jgi:hypothetical protein